MSNQELAHTAQQQVSQMYLDIGNTAVMKELLFNHQYMYACLLKMATIQLKSPSASLGKKMATFLEFCHATLATMNAREAAVARTYFARGQDLGFFGKIQKRKPDILELLRNMAWDMWHVRQLEKSLIFNPAKQARYFFPALLTFDHKFIEIMDLYPLKACAFKIGSTQPLPFFDGDPFRLIATDDENGASAVKKYFSNDAISTRNAVRDSVKTKFAGVVQMLEADLLAVAGK